jgi:hypothetical protein
MEGTLVMITGAAPTVTLLITGFDPEGYRPGLCTEEVAWRMRENANCCSTGRAPKSAA